jgi:histidinol-phosphate aminotransferase
MALSDGPSSEPAWLVPALRGLASFIGPSGPASGSSPALRPLHLNESPYPPSPHVAPAVAEALSTLNRYPDVYGAALAQAIAARTAVAANRIVFGCGSEELIFAVAAISLTPGDGVVVPAPGFPAFSMAARMRGARVLRAPLDPGGANDAHALIEAIDDRTKLLFCCTPNPPSGGMMTAAAVEAAVHGIPDHVILVLDEAYCEFARHAGGPDLLEIVRRRTGNWVLLRTFSKAYGLAGARIGYALCGSEAIADALRKAKLQYGASLLGQTAALAALSDEDHLDRTIAAIAEERSRLSAGLCDLGLVPWPTAANFVSARMPMPAKDAMAELRRSGILVRDWRDPEHTHEIRITVGRPDDTDAVIRVIGDMLSESAV